MSRFLVMSLLLLLIVAGSFSQTTRRVPQEYATIQAAINAAVNGDTVLVADGTYVENLRITKKITLASLFLIDRDTSHISRTIINGGSPSHPDTASVITIGPGTDSTTVVLGFTITNGSGTKLYLAGVYYRYGGGINVMAGGVTIHRNRIIANIINGTSLLPNAGGAGVNIYPAAGPISSWIIKENDIIDNQALGSDSRGGGCNAVGNGWIERNKFINNVASSEVISGISIRGASGGGIQIYSDPLSTANVSMEGNLILGNRSIYGSAITTSGYSSTYDVTVRFSNNIIVRNVALATLPGKLPDNGPVHLQRSTTEFVNNTIADNDGYCAIRIGLIPSSSRLLNNIVWNSQISYQILIASGAPPNPLAASYNCIYGGYSGTGNSWSDPQFVVDDMLFRLQDTSPCIAAGLHTASVGSVQLVDPDIDFLGNPRPRPKWMRPDLGAIEHDSGSVDDPTTGVEEIRSASLPTELALEQNFPNPFNPSTTIRFSLPHESVVRLTIFNLLGQEIAQLVNEQLTPGVKQVTWDARVSTGVYLYRLDVEGVNKERYSETRRMTVLR